MKVQTSDLIGAQLDWAVAKCEPVRVADAEMPDVFEEMHRTGAYNYSTDWSQGGPIIDREKIELENDGFQWWARIRADEDFSGPTALIAAMRALVASKLGDELEIPNDLLC